MPPAGRVHADAAPGERSSVWFVLATEEDLPPGDGWLTREERAGLDRLRPPLRRAEWRLGRWAAKHAAVEVLGDVRASDVAIVTRADGSPEARIGGRPARVAISISHRAGRAMGAAADPEVAIGCDLELVERRDDAFLAGVLSADERAALERLSPRRRIERVALLWSAKESAVKALGLDIRTDPRALHAAVEGIGRGWSPLVVGTDDRKLEGWWSVLAPLVATVVADPPPAPPRAASWGALRH